MGKVSLSITVNNEIISLLEKGYKNKSELINKILERALTTEEGIKEDIDFHKQEIIRLEKELENIKQREKEKIEKIPQSLKDKLKDVSLILKKHPDKLYIWTEIINRDYKQTLFPYDLKRLIERWA